VFSSPKNSGAGMLPEEEQRGRKRRGQSTAVIRRRMARLSVAKDRRAGSAALAGPCCQGVASFYLLAADRVPRSPPVTNFPSWSWPWGASRLDGPAGSRHRRRPCRHQPVKLGKIRSTSKCARLVVLSRSMRAPRARLAKLRSARFARPSELPSDLCVPHSLVARAAEEGVPAVRTAPPPLRWRSEQPLREHSMPSNGDGLKDPGGGSGEGSY